MRVHHLNCATMRPPSRRLVNGDGSLFAAGRLVCHCLLVESAAGLVLVDTGFGLGDIADPRARLGAGMLATACPVLEERETALRQVEGLGHAARDVRHIVLTHLDLDHAGGLGDFPDAEVHVLSVEHAAAEARSTFLERGRYRPAQWAHGPRWHLHDGTGERWLGFDAVRAVEGTGDEILIVPLHGHTRGHAAIAVRDADGRWLLDAGDAYFHHRELDAARPTCPIGLRLYQRLIAMDDPLRRANQQRLRELARDHGGEVRIFSAHDPVELEPFVTSAG